MRKSILFGLALLSLAAVSCSREMEAPVAKNDVKLVTLGASLADTKAAISDNGAFTWQAGDAMSVATDGGFVKFTLSAGAGSSSADFSAILDASTKIGEVAIYPAGAHVLEGNTLTVNLPEAYVFEEDNTNVPLLGAVSDHAVAMKYIGGVVRFPVTAMPEGAAKIVLSADKKISGDFPLDYSSADAVLEAGDGESSVTYTFSEVKDRMVFNFPLPVGEYHLKLQVLDAAGAPVFVKEGSAASLIAAGTVLVYNDLEVELPKVNMNGDLYPSVAAALAAAENLLEGEAAITLLDDIKENIVINGRRLAVPVSIDGNENTIDGSIEVLESEVSIVNATIKPSAPRSYTAFTEADALSQAWPNNFGIYVHAPGYGFTLDNVTLDITALNTEAEASGGDIGTAILMRPEGVAPNEIKRDVVKNSTILGRTHRLMQIEHAPLDLVGNTFSGAYSYAIRIYTDCDLLLKGNEFLNGSSAAIDFRSDAQNTVLILGDGLANDNTIDDTYAGFIKGAAGSLEPEKNNVFKPALVAKDGWLVPEEVEEAFAQKLWGKTVAELGIPASTYSQSLLLAVNNGKLWIANEDKVYGYELFTGADYKTVTFPVPVRSLDSDDSASKAIWAYERGFREGDPEWAAPEPVFVTSSIEGVGGTLEAPQGFELLGNAGNSFTVSPGSPYMSNFKVTGDLAGNAVVTYGISSWGRAYSVPLESKNGALTGRYVWISPWEGRKEDETEINITLWNPFNVQTVAYGNTLEEGMLHTFYKGSATPILFSNSYKIGWDTNVAYNNFATFKPVIDNQRAWRIYRTDIVTYNGHRYYALFTHCIDDAIADESNYLDLYDVTDLSAISLVGTIEPELFTKRAEGFGIGDAYPGDVKLQVLDGSLYAFCADGRNGTVNAFKINIPEPVVAEGEVEGPDVTVTPGGKF